MNLRLFRILYQNWFLGTPPNPPYRHVVQIGDPVLRLQAKPVDPTTIRSDNMIRLYNRLYYMLKMTKAAGLAAPQIGVSLRLFAIQFPEKKDFATPSIYDRHGMEPIPFQIWINPTVKVLDYQKVFAEECCESMKGFSAEIPRYKRIHLTGLNEKGEERNWEAKGWPARLIQHEIDHLDGKFFTDTMHPKSLTCTNWNAINHHQGRIYTTYMPKR